MKHFHSIRLSVFSKPEDDEEKVKNTLLSLVPFDINKEKVILTTENVTGFTERKIKIFEIKLEKQRHTEDFFGFLLSKLNDYQKRLLLRQKESRLDDNMDFFIRLDKERLYNNEYFITDDGNCFHIKIRIAAFPARKEIALKIIEGLLSEEKVQ